MSKAALTIGCRTTTKARCTFAASEPRRYPFAIATGANVGFGSLSAITGGTAKLCDFRAVVSLKAPYLERDGAKYQLSPGMQVSAEINLGSRTVLEYLLSPIQKTMHEAGRER